MAGISLAFSQKGVMFTRRSAGARQGILDRSFALISYRIRRALTASSLDHACVALGEASGAPLLHDPRTGAALLGGTDTSSPGQDGAA